jgi:3-phosphoshikimate 1-carboxyvinyltransferase
MISYQTTALFGTAHVPGDKSISHRALMLGSVAVGETIIHGLLTSDDILNTKDALVQLGVTIIHDEVNDCWHVHGVGTGGFTEPETVLDFGNSGTGVRLMTGLLATHPFTTFVTGDSSLVRRPMERITAPLMRMGTNFINRCGGYLPMAIIGTELPVPIVYNLPVASAQVKSTILLAGLNAPGCTTVIEHQPTRDHTEIMLRNFGASLLVEKTENQCHTVTLVGQPELKSQVIHVPADISSAAFPLVGALLRPGSDIVLKAVGVNPKRIGLLQTLEEMGADIQICNLCDEHGEPVGDLHVRATRDLHGVSISPDRAPIMIDEYPILAIAAACASGPTRLFGLSELRVKESDRLNMIANGLTACGVKIEAGEDNLVIIGTGKPPPGGKRIKVGFDHRIAMSFLILGMATPEPVSIDDACSINTSFPGFADLMNQLGGCIRQLV